MESTLYESFTVSPDSTPQTPSPRTSVSLDDLHIGSNPFGDPVKPPIDFDPIESHNIFSDSYHQYPHGMSDDTITHAVENPAIWSGNHSTHYFPSQRGSLLQELYDGGDHLSDRHHDMYMDHSADAHAFGGSEWNNSNQLPHSALPSHLHDHGVSRRASFPSVRHDREDGIGHHSGPVFMGDHPDSFAPYGSRADAFYSEPLPMDGSPQPTLSAEPSALHGHLSQPPRLEEAYLCGSPHHSMRDMDQHSSDGIKLEDNQPVVVPSQHVFYPRPPSSSGMSPMPMYMSPHGAIPVQHTDDAASKETQYLRRRCFNCHTTEPPSWRRSTLNPGKIVCNKCGLYERTHLRPRPHRFDELRAGNKAGRKHSQPKVLGGSHSPKERAGTLVKKEQGDYDFEGPSRRGSVSGSSVHSASSDFDDNVSVYSSTGSVGGTPSSYNSPLMSSYTISRMSPSLSPSMPPADASGIRLPNAPLSDIASLQPAPNSPRKAATTPYYNSNGRPISPAGDYFGRRGSMPVESQHRHPLGSNGSAFGLPEVTGWQSVPLSDLEPKSAARSRSSSRKPTAS